MELQCIKCLLNVGSWELRYSKQYRTIAPDVDKRKCNKSHGLTFRLTTYNFSNFKIGLAFMAALKFKTTCVCLQQVAKRAFTDI